MSSPNFHRRLELEPLEARWAPSSLFLGGGLSRVLVEPVDSTVRIYPTDPVYPIDPVAPSPIFAFVMKPAKGLLIAAQPSLLHD